MRTFPAAPALMLALLLAACGSGVELRLFVAFNAPPSRTSATVIILSGVAALPAGSARTGGTRLQPVVTCQPGTFSITWTNDANGAHGDVSALWDCPADQLAWSSGAIPLARGANRITVAMADALGSTASTVTVTREWIIESIGRWKPGEGDGSPPPQGVSEASRGK